MCSNCVKTGLNGTSAFKISPKIAFGIKPATIPIATPFNKLKRKYLGPILVPGCVG